MQHVDHHSIWLETMMYNNYHLGFNPAEETVWKSAHRLMIEDAAMLFNLIERVIYEIQSSTESQMGHQLAKRRQLPIVFDWTNLVIDSISTLVSMITDNHISMMEKDGFLTRDMLSKRQVAVESLLQSLSQCRECCEDAREARAEFISSGMNKELKETMHTMEHAVKGLRAAVLVLVNIEEECFNTILLPNYTPDDVLQLEHRMWRTFRGGHWTALPHFYRLHEIESVRERARLIHRQWGVSYPTLALFFSSAFQRYNDNYTRPAQKLLAPHEVETLESEEHQTFVCCKVMGAIDMCSMCSCGQGLRCCVCLPWCCFSYVWRDNKSFVVRESVRYLEALHDILFATPISCAKSVGFCIEDTFIDCKKQCKFCSKSFYDYCCDFSYCNTIYDECCSYTCTVTVAYLGFSWQCPTLSEICEVMSDTLYLKPRLLCVACCTDVVRGEYTPRCDATKCRMDCQDTCFSCVCVRPRVYVDGLVKLMTCNYDVVNEGRPCLCEKPCVYAGMLVSSIGTAMSPLFRFCNYSAKGCADFCGCQDCCCCCFDFSETEEGKPKA
jgi:hypothetical protein